MTHIEPRGDARRIECDATRRVQGRVQCVSRGADNRRGARQVSVAPPGSRGDEALRAAKQRAPGNHTPTKLVLSHF